MMDPIHAQQIKGFLTPDEGRRLFDLAKIGSALGPCLEIGSYCGKSASYLGAACKTNRTVLYSIDHHRGSEEQQPGEAFFDPALFDPAAGRIDTFRTFTDTLERCGLLDTVIPIVARSAVAACSWATPLGLVFIDGGHAYETVLTDYTLWHSHIRAGGFLVFHDIYPSPQDGGQAPYEVYGLAKRSGLFDEAPMTGSLGVLQRKGEPARPLHPAREPKRRER